MKNTSWKTTLIGCLLAIVVAVQPLIATGTIDWKQVIIAALIAALSFVMKDADVTGGTRTNNETLTK
jgi:hypothetical protein